MFELIYIINIAVYVIITFFVKKSSQKKVYMILSYILLVIGACVRDFSVGTDTKNYARIFELIKAGADRKFVHGETGFYLYMKSISLMTSEFRIYLLFTAILTYAFFYRYIYYNAQDYVLSILLFISLFYPDSMNLARQYMAIGLAMNYEMAIQKNKNLAAVLLCVMAMLIHRSAVIYVLLMFLYKNRKKNITKIIYCVLCLGLLIIAYLSDLLVWLISKTDYKLYLSTKFMQANSNNGGMSKAYLMVMVMGYIALLVTYKNIKKYKLESDYLFYLFLSSMGTILVLFSNKFIILSRVALLLDLYIIVFLPYFMKKTLSKQSYIWAKIGIGCLLFVAVHIMAQDVNYVLGI